MPTIKLTPSTYYRSNNTYVTVTNDTNMYYDTSHTANYATLKGRNRNSSTAYYAFIGGFNFNAVPSNAIVNSFTIRIRCYRSSNQRTGNDYYMRLTSAASTSSVISGTTTSTNIGTSASNIEIPTGNLNWNTMVGYGDLFSIEVPLSSTSSSSYPYVYVYGAEIEVDYSLPYTISVSGAAGSSGYNVSGNGEVAEGSNATITFQAQNTGHIIDSLTDNCNDVTNDVVSIGGDQFTYTINNVQEDHTILATITAIPEVVDWKIKVQTQTRDINSNGTWASIDTPYYKMNNSWITPEKVYYKHGGNWLLVWPLTPPSPSHLLFAADLTSDLSYISYIDNKLTGNFTANTDFTPTYDADGLLFSANASNFRIGTVIPTALNTFLHTANQEIWFSMRATVIRDAAGSTSYSSGCDYGWGTNTSYPYQRNDTAHNFFSINGEYYKNRSGEPYVPAGTTVWLKTQYTSAGAFIQRVFSYSTWTGSNAYSNPGTWQQNFSNTTSSKAIWNNPNHTTMGLHHGLQEIKVRDFKIWSSEPTDAEIGIQ